MPGGRGATGAAQDDSQTDPGQTDARARLCPWSPSGVGDRRYGLWRGLQTAQLAGRAPAALCVGRAHESARWAPSPCPFLRGPLACREVAALVSRRRQSRASLLRLGLAVSRLPLDRARVEAVAARPAQPL